MLNISQAEYVEKVLKRFNISDDKHVNVPLGDHFKLSKAQALTTKDEKGHFKLSKAQALTTEDEKALMSEVSYASAVGNLMKTMVCMRPDIALAVGVSASIVECLKITEVRVSKYKPHTSIEGRVSTLNTELAFLY